MSKTIPEPLIREVRERTDIVDVIGEVVELKKQGQDRYVGLCPFHGENTPSFSVSKDRQLYHCFGCKASGNVVSFLIDHGKLSFQEAIMKLADNLNIDTQHVELSPEPTSEGEKMREGHSLAARFYHHLLMNTEQGRAAYQYFKERGVNEEAMLHFRLGYAPRERSSLKTLLDKREFDLKLMQTPVYCRCLKMGEALMIAFLIGSCFRCMILVESMLVLMHEHSSKTTIRSI